MRDLKISFKNKIIDFNKLLDYGFIKNDNYYYEKNIFDDSFKVVVILSEEKQLSKVIDLETSEEYTLIDVNDSNGKFNGTIKEEYENILKDIIDKCTYRNVFKSKQSKEVIKYIKEKYDDDLEFLWEKFDNNAIWRNKRNNKWYGLLLAINRNKLGFDSNEEVEIIDLRYQKDMVDDIIDNKSILKGYHMNKRSWITIILDGSININKIIELIDNSYELSVLTK